MCIYKERETERQTNMCLHIYIYIYIYSNIYIYRERERCVYLRVYISNAANPAGKMAATSFPTKGGSCVYQSEVDGGATIALELRDATPALQPWGAKPTLLTDRK